MGNEQSNPVRNLDKRTARREYGERFQQAIRDFRLRSRSSTGDVPSAEQPAEEWEPGAIRVCVRKRPIFPSEVSNHEFDVITCVDEQNIVVHDARMGKDMKKMMMNHHAFTFDRIFNEKCGNDEVYEQTASPLTKIAINGGFATCLMYGQTGSGKTFTMSAIYEKAAAELFQAIDCDEDKYSIALSFVELSGDTCSDLLNAFKPAQLITGKDGGVYAYPIVEPEVSSEQELVAFINHGRNVRTTAATGVNDTSSRSHAILRIYVWNKETDTEGVLTLVDLAGSEHRIDSMYHSAERRKEGAGINASLMALKECLRAKASKSDASFYYRKSKLTMALKSSFSNPLARTVVIVTASPASKDTEHSLNSLRHACIMHGQDTSAGGETRFVTGGTTTVEKLGEIDVAAIAKKNYMNKKCGRGIEDLKTSNGNNKGPSSSSFGSDISGTELSKDEELKKKLRMRRASEKKAISLLTSNQKKALKLARDSLRQNGRQEKRISRLRPQTPEHVLRPQEEQGQHEEVQSDEAAMIEARQRLQHRLGRQQPLAACTGDNEDDGGGNDYSDDEEDESGYQCNQRLRYQNRSNLTYRQEEVHSEQTASPTRRHQHSYSSSPPEVAKSTASAQPARRKVSKIRAMIFSDDYTPLDIKLRQFRASLKKHGYSKNEVQSILDKEASSSSEGRDVSGDVLTGAERAAGTPLRQSPVTVDTPKSSCKSRRRPVQHSPPPSPPHPSPPDRAEAARERRRQQEEAQREARKAKLAKKLQSSPSATGDVWEMEQLERQLRQPDLSAATKHALKKKLASHRAVRVREERRRNQEQRQAKEAARRQQQSVKQELNFSSESNSHRNDDNDSNDNNANHQKLRMENTTAIESVLSPRCREDRSFSPVQRRGPPRPHPSPSLPSSADHAERTGHSRGHVEEASTRSHLTHDNSRNSRGYYPQDHAPKRRDHNTASAYQPKYINGLRAPGREQDGYDSLDSLRMHTESARRSTNSGGDNTTESPSGYYRGHMGAGESSAGGLMLRTRSQGGGKTAATSAAYSSPFATEYNYMTAKEGPY